MLSWDMAYRIEHLDGDARQRDKQASRDLDAARLAAGEISPLNLRRENDFFASVPWSRFELVTQGGKPVTPR